MFVIIYKLYIKTAVINLVIDLSLHSQLIKVYCYCIYFKYNIRANYFMEMNINKCDPV